MGMRYIDPYQLADKVAESMRDNPHEGKIALNHRLEHEHFLRMIALAPDADVAPIIHARWEKVCMNRRKCSSCNLSRNTDVETTWNYCPRCGAKMELEDKE
jgi:hypothetical protein